MLIPCLWMMLTSLKTAPETIAGRPIWSRKALQWSNYVKAWNEAPFGEYAKNSKIVTVVTTVGQLATSSFAAAALLRLKAYGKNSLFKIALGTMMSSGEMLKIPNAETLSH